MSNLMKPNRLRRGMAIFLLAFAFFDLTVVDMFSPEFCDDEQVSLSLANPDEAPEKIADGSWAIRSHDSEPGRDSRQSPIDEDCFCCCSHIIPSSYACIATLNCTPQPDALAAASLPLAPPRDAFHPPRFS